MATDTEIAADAVPVDTSPLRATWSIEIVSHVRLGGRRSRGPDPVPLIGHVTGHAYRDLVIFPNAS